MAIQACVRKKHFPLILVMALLILTTISCDDVLYKLFVVGWKLILVTVGTSTVKWLIIYCILNFTVSVKMIVISSLWELTNL